MRKYAQAHKQLRSDTSLHNSINFQPVSAALAGGFVAPWARCGAAVMSVTLEQRCCGRRLHRTQARACGGATVHKGRNTVQLHSTCSSVPCIGAAGDSS